MCGLTLAANKKGRAGQRAFELYVKQKHRGQKGFGYLAISNGILTNLGRGKYEHDVRSSILAEKADLVLFHHRLPTSTENTVGTTHPIFVSNPELEYDYYVMHNGCVTNDEFLKTKHESLGYKYTTEFKEVTYAEKPDGSQEVLSIGQTEFNDSECLAIEAARFIEGKQDKMHNIGAAAFFVAQLEKGAKKVNMVYFAQNFGRSLGMKKKKGWTIVASEFGKDVPQMQLHTLDPLTYEISRSELDMDEAAKVTPSPYQTPAVQQSFIEPPVPRGNPYGLVNAYYTQREAEESGAPMSSFYSSSSMWADGRWQVMYVPCIFSGIDFEKREVFSEAYHYLPEPVVDGAQERLEELAMKYARKQHEFDYICESWVKSKLPNNVYKSRRTSLEKTLNELEEEMSTLGLEQSLVEETVQTAQEMVDYEYSTK